MTQKIICIAGHMQSGKSSLANFITGYELLRNNVVKWFDISEEGKLQVPAIVVDENNNKTDSVGVMDLDRKDEEFINYAQQMVWPYCKIYSFADRLKQILILLFGVKEEQLYGTNEQKNTPTNIKWKDIEFLLSSEKREKLSLKTPDPKTFALNDSWEKFLTGRDMAQVFGSDVCRKIKDDCWVETCHNDIYHEGYPFVVIADARFPNELDFMKDHGAILVRLTRSPHEDNHISETALDGYDKYDLTIDNRKMSLKEKNRALLNYLISIGWTGSVSS